MGWKIGPRLEFEASVLGAPDLGAGEIGGQQVGGELHAGEVGFQPRRQRTHRSGLGQPRRAFDQEMAVREQGDQQALDQPGLAHDLA